MNWVDEPGADAVVKTVSLSVATLLWFGAPAPQTPTAEPAEPALAPGLSFGEGITKREREPLRERFNHVLETVCAPPPCTEECSEDEARVGVEIRGDDRNYTLEWTADDPRLGEPLTLTSPCELCSLVELQDQLATDLGSLCSALSSLDAGPGRLRVMSTPSGAVVRVNGRKVGKTPWSGELAAGDYAVEIEARGYESESRTLQLVGGGVEESLSVILMSEATGPSLARRPWWPAWTGIGVGVVLGIAGTALIAINGKEWGGRCTGPNVDAFGNCSHVYATRPLGIALASIGAGAFGAGVGLMVWAQQGQVSASVAWTRSF